MCQVSEALAIQEEKEYTEGQLQAMFDEIAIEFGFNKDTYEEEWEEFICDPEGYFYKEY